MQESSDNDLGDEVGMRLMGNPGRYQGPVERWETSVGLKDWDLGS